MFFCLSVYDATGSLIGMQYHANTYAEGEWNVYCFEKNILGDVTAVWSDDGVKLISYVYDAWGDTFTRYYNGGNNSTAKKNSMTYRGYYFDSDLGLYYLNSRYYDFETGRFISPDDLSYLGANGDILSYNLYAYCSNNPIMFTDPSGHSAAVIIAGAIVAGAVVGGLMGAFSALTTDGNIAESVTIGALTGALSVACGYWGFHAKALHLVVAGAGGFFIDAFTQAIVQYSENQSIDLSKIDYLQSTKTAINTVVSTLIPGFSDDYFTSAFVWLEASVLLTALDSIFVNAFG